MCVRGGDGGGGGTCVYKVKQTTITQCIVVIVFGERRDGVPKPIVELAKVGRVEQGFPEKVTLELKLKG